MLRQSIERLPRNKRADMLPPAPPGQLWVPMGLLDSPVFASYTLIETLFAPSRGTIVAQKLGLDIVVQSCEASPEIIELTLGLAFELLL